MALLAVLEYRTVNDQATYLIAEGLRRRGMLSGLKSAPAPENGDDWEWNYENSPEWLKRLVANQRAGITNDDDRDRLI